MIYTRPLTFPLPAVVCATVLIGVFAAALWGRSLLRRFLSYGLAGTALFVPFTAAEKWAGTRAVLSLFSLLFVVRVVDMCRSRHDMSVGQRIWFMFAPFDTRAVQRVRPAFDRSALLAIVGYTALGLGAYAVLVQNLGRVSSGPWIVFRWALGLIAFYAFMDLIAAVLSQLYLLGGLRVPSFQNAPILSRTLAEFWGKRWNREVHRILRHHVFLPFARQRRPLLGIILVFLVSGLLHFWIHLPATGWTMGLMCASFFFVQGLLVLTEALLGVENWNHVRARTWTVFALILPSPLFIEPVLRLIV